MSYIVTIKDVQAKALRLQDTSESPPPDATPDADEIYAFGFVIVTDRDGDQRGPILPIPKSVPVKFTANGEEHFLDSSGIRVQHTVTDGMVFHAFMILMEEDTGAVAGDVSDAIRRLVEKVLPAARDVDVAEAILEGTQVDSALLFIGAFVDWFLATFNADDFIGKVICDRIDVSDLVMGKVSKEVAETLEGGNAKYRLKFTVALEANP